MRKFTKNNDGVEPSDEFYEAMSWGGLKDSKVKAWMDLSREKQASINQIADNWVPKLTKNAVCP